MDEQEKFARAYKILVGVHKSLVIKDLRDSLLEAIGLIEEIRVARKETLFEEAKGQRGKRFSN
jgi:hypothetical protein